MANHHISKDKNRGDWKIVREGNPNPIGHAPTQKEAERIAKNLTANTGGGEVRIHGLDGKIRDSDTVKPGRDPFPPRDKKH